jgi:hypothetical protein
LIVFATCLACTLTLLAAEPANAIYDQLTHEGLVVDTEGKKRIKLPAPAMADGLDAARQRAVIENLPRRRPYNEMVRDAIVAPVATEIENLPAQGGDPLRRIDVWYIVYGKLDQFFDEKLANSMADLGRGEKRDEANGGGSLPNEVLKRYGIDARQEATIKEQFVYNTGVLFDKVQVGATRHVVATRGDESIIVTATIDPRFNNDPKYGNFWCSVDNESRPPKLGERHLYTTSGSYTKITKLKEPPGAILVEHHYLTSEPYGWFRGAPLLSSKLPMVIQDSVRKLRRELRTGRE